MFSELANSIGTVKVMTSHNGGFSAEQLAERALDQIIAIGDNAPPVIAEQARAYREELRVILVYFMYEAMRSRNVTMVSKFAKAGFPELTKLIDQ